MNQSIIALAAGVALFPIAAHAHDHWVTGEPVPAWVKTECCGPKDAHHLRPDQVRRNAAGDYVVDITPIPSRRARLCPVKMAITGCSSTMTMLLRQCQVLLRARTVLAQSERLGRSADASVLDECKRLGPSF